MPPVRSFSMPKPVKTERTHEENQERAYIAASRRSDRSLEARIESARRASEIHKRRTGRSLRVTEQDVVNEEMYEEEDGDLPLQYRRLTAHLNGNSSDFNRRLAAYLTNHVAMRSALDHAMQSSYPGQYPQPWQAPQTNYQPWAPDQQRFASYQSPTTPQQQQQKMVAPQMMHTSAANYRQSPYPASGSQARSASIAVTPSADGSNGNQPASGTDDKGDRQASMSATSGTPNVTSPVPGEETSGKLASGSSSKDGKTASPGVMTMGELYHYAMPTPGWSPAQQQPGTSYSPLTTSLPNETKMFFGPHFNMGDFVGSPMSPSEKDQMPIYSYNPNAPNKMRSQSSGLAGGMSQTLAPSALEGKFEKPAWSTSAAAQNEPMDDLDNQQFDSNYTLDMENDDSTTFDATKDSLHELGEVNVSGQMTPNDSEWAAFIDPASWDDTASA